MEQIVYKGCLHLMPSAVVWEIWFSSSVNQTDILHLLNPLTRWSSITIADYLRYLALDSRYLTSFLYFFKAIGCVRNREMVANEHITIDINSYEKLKTFKYLGPLLKNQNSIDEERRCRLRAGRII